MFTLVAIFTNISRDFLSVAITSEAQKIAVNSFVTLFKSPHTITSGLLAHGAQKQGFLA